MSSPDDDVTLDRGTFELFGAITSAMAADAAFTTNSLIKSLEGSYADMAKSFMSLFDGLQKVPYYSRPVWLQDLLEEHAWVREHAEERVARYSGHQEHR